MQRIRAALRICLWFLPAVLIRLVRPWVYIRTGKVVSARLGHLSLNSEMYLSARHISSRDLTGEDSMDLFCYQDDMPIANDYLFSLVRQKLTVRKWVRGLHEVNLLLKSHTVKEYTDIDYTGILTSVGHQIERPPSPWEFKYVCIYNRDNRYLENLCEKLGRPHTNKHQMRNSPVSVLYPAINWLLDRNYWVFRMGNMPEEKAEINHPRFVDYHRHRFPESMQIKLLANCRFALGSATGLNGPSVMFRRLIGVFDIPDHECSEQMRISPLIMPRTLSEGKATGDDVLFMAQKLHDRVKTFPPQY